jgi:hypothetical protein
MKGRQQLAPILRTSRLIRPTRIAPVYAPTSGKLHIPITFAAITS